VRTGKAVTQNYLHYAKTINDCYRYQESTLPTVGERGVGDIERNLQASNNPQKALYAQSSIVRI
jgi:hypothetical protein